MTELADAFDCSALVEWAAAQADVPLELLPEPHERSAAALAPPAVTRLDSERAERRAHREERRAAILRGDLYA